MKHVGMTVLALAFLLPACGKQAEEGSAGVQAPPDPAPEQSVSQAPHAVEPAPEPVATPTQPAVTTEKSATTPVPATPSGKPAAAVLTREEALALAQQSGCLACHKIESKVVGPAWQDVSAKYKGDAEAKARLVAKVKAGGKGNWTEVTGGMMMPPYSPRVSDGDIEKLVTFVLAL